MSTKCKISNINVGRKKNLMRLCTPKKEKEEPANAHELYGMVNKVKEVPGSEETKNDPSLDGK